VLFAKFETLPEKIFSSIAHNEQSSKNYFAAKRRQTSSSIDLGMHAIAIIATNRRGTRCSGVTPTRSAAVAARNTRHGDNLETGKAHRRVVAARKPYRSRTPDRSGMEDQSRRARFGGLRTAEKSERRQRSRAYFP
jgi:hypothetical protein